MTRPQLDSTTVLIIMQQQGKLFMERGGHKGVKKEYLTNSVVSL
jgi:hypothetical protein